MSSKRNKLKILLVEDAPYVVEKVNDVFASLHCIEEVRVAATEKDALNIIESLWPNVVIVDLMLKEGNGFGVLRSMKAMNRRPACIVFTNYALPNYREYAELLGVDYFLDKAKDFESLCNVVDSVHRSSLHP